jgi:hypothetical protein
MTKLALIAKPTFKQKVSIPVAGEPPVDVEMTFKHKTKTQLIEFQNSLAEKSDPELFMEMVDGWDLEHEFNLENVTTFLENYIGSAWATYDKYRTELIQAKLGN